MAAPGLTGMIGNSKKKVPAPLSATYDYRLAGPTVQPETLSVADWSVKRGWGKMGAARDHIGPPGNRKLGILVVEDEYIVAWDLQTHLTNLGYRVTGIAQSGKMALAMLDQTRPDLVLMDIRLQGKMNGLEAAAEIRKRCQIPIIFVSAFADKSLQEIEKEVDPFTCLSKPFNSMGIDRAINAAIGSPLV